MRVISALSLFTTVSNHHQRVSFHMTGQALTLNLIPQHRNRYPPFVTRVSFQVQLLQPSHPILRVLVWPATPREIPAVGGISCIDFDQLNDILQSLECSNYDCAVRPRTHVVEIKNIATFLCGETLRRYDAAEVGRHSSPIFLEIHYPTEVSSIFLRGASERR
jgi:hypothetical protein